MFAQVGLVALSALTLVSAQTESNSTWTLSSDDFTASQASSWCSAQYDSCNTLCGTATINNCDTGSLNFECQCLSGKYPNMNEFMQTIPYYACETLQSNCIIANQNDANGQKNCTETFQDNCPSENPDDHTGEFAASSSSSSSSSSTTATATAGSASSSSTSSVSQGGAAMPTAAMNVLGNGAAAVAVGLFAYAL
ncbi:hypothetical protein GGR56DRAFT_622729 [Xylariaceae sp. FL0804]|nr:hypothetical protein GGR56DRAFT_622729 [Xylariaceae sp. FL0804]